MENFWDFNVWSAFNILAVLLISLLVANVLRRSIKFLRNSLIPVSVLAGALLLLVASVYKLITGEVMFDTAFFGGSGSVSLEIITYHCLALGFIASTFKPSGQKLNKKRTSEIFNTGLQTVSTYLIQAIVGLGISLLAILAIPSFFKAAGILLPFGYGQGTGQALNYGGIFENEYGFTGGKSFGLTIAALGFICASIGGVIHLNILKIRGKVKVQDAAKTSGEAHAQAADQDLPMNESIDKLTIQVALIAAAYVITYLLMTGLGALLPGMKSVIFGFNFLIGVLSATLIKALLKLLKKAKLVKKEYTDNFLMTRASNFFFDIMVVAGIAAIRFGLLEKYWGIILIMGFTGMIITYFYNYLVAKVLFPEYPQE
jgi:ESS family glutamate:Na+ symporter